MNSSFGIEILKHLNYRLRDNVREIVYGDLLIFGA